MRRRLRQILSGWSPAFVCLLALLALGIVFCAQLPFLQGRVQTQRRSRAAEIPYVQQSLPEAAPDGAQRINLNTAPASELMLLPRVGEKTAARIIAYRETVCPFICTEQLMDVEGVGEGTYERLKDLVTVK